MITTDQQLQIAQTAVANLQRVLLAARKVHTPHEYRFMAAPILLELQQREQEIMSYLSQTALEAVQSVAPVAEQRRVLSPHQKAEQDTGAFCYPHHLITLRPTHRQGPIESPGRRHLHDAARAAAAIRPAALRAEGQRNLERG